MRLDQADAPLTELDTTPRRALGNAAQARLAAELISALGTTKGSVRPRYRRRAPPPDLGPEY